MPFNASPRWRAAENKYTPSRVNCVFPHVCLSQYASNRDRRDVCMSTKMFRTLIYEQHF